MKDKEFPRKLGREEDRLLQTVHWEELMPRKTWRLLEIPCSSSWLEA